MINRIQQFGQWLAKKRSFQVTWFAKDSQTPPDTEEALTQLPDDMVERLMAVVEDLPVHPHERKSVLAAVEDAIAHWQARPHAAANSIVVLGDPVSSIPRILTDSLDQLDVDHSQPSLSVKLLDWIERPADVKTIEQRLKETLGFTEQPVAEAAQTVSGGSSSQALIVIPNLCWCFLRSADGLDGLDCLQDLLLSDRNQFWILGSSIVGWEYLKHTLKFNAYCGGTTLLPKLSGEDLQHWLNPIVEEFDICFPDAALHKRLRNPDSLPDIDMTIDKPIKTLSEISQEVSATVQSSARAMKDMVAQPNEDDVEDTPKLDYFNRLADISDGVGIVALQLFIKSLRYQQIDEKTSSAGKDASSDKDISPDFSENASKESVADAENSQLVTTVPKRPSLPSLSQSDMYLLYSLLLHSDMTIDALAKSLGDSSQIVNNQVQVLRNAGVIEQRENIIKINPEHYPELRRKLARNNFIIEIP